MEYSLTEQISRFVHATTFDSLPLSICNLARDHFLDTLGCCLVGCSSEVYPVLRDYLLSEETSAQATALGFSKQLSLSQAAFVNGFLARATEFDDMAMPDLHPSGVILPIVLALAQTSGCSGKEILTAFSIGIELCIRLARAAYDSVARTSRFLKRGQDSTAICGAVAGAAAAAKLMGLDSEKIAHAMAIAVSFASGSLESNRTGGNIKQFQSGWAAKSAMQAALLAKQGITGPLQALEGQYGFYQCFVDGHFDEKELIGELGDYWLLSSLRYKPYPCNYYTHAGIDAATQFHQEGLNPEDIHSIHLQIAPAMCRTVGEPIERKRNPSTPYEAKFSAPYTVASALLGGGGLGVGLDDFTLDHIQDVKRLALMQKIEVSSSDACHLIFPEHAPAILSIIMQDGKQLIKEAFVNRGSPENPLTENELAIKFKSNAAHALKDKVAIERLYSLVSEIDRLQHIDSIFDILKTISLPASSS